MYEMVGAILGLRTDDNAKCNRLALDTFLRFIAIFLSSIGRLDCLPSTQESLNYARSSNITKDVIGFSLR